MYECEGDSISNPRDDMMSLGNSSLGMQCESVEEFARGTDSKTAQPSQIPQSSHSHTANTRIVCGEIQDSKANSESTPSVIASQALQSIESTLHTNLESKADSELILAVGHCPTAIKIKSCVAQTESRPLRGVQKSEARRAVVPRRRFLARSGNSEALPLIAEKKKRSFILFGAKGSGEGINPFSFCDTRFKESIESKEVKSGDSEKADLESEILKIQEAKTKDSKALDLESKRRVESAGARDSEKQALESEKLEFATDLESKNQAESTSLKALDSHSLSQSTAKIACFLPIVVGRTHFIFKEHVWKRL